jgi:hypothetical protein
MTVVASIAGPVPEQIVVQMSEENKPEVKPSCIDSTQKGAKPAIRIQAFVDHFNDAAQMGEWAFTSVCQSNFGSALEGVGNKLAEIMAEKCPAKPFAGCRAGPAGTECSPCLPSCTLYDIQNRGRDSQQRMKIHWCGHICQHGLCTRADLSPCERDENGRCQCPAGLSPTKLGDEEGCAPLLYPQSPPSDRDERLLDLIPRELPPCQGPECDDAGVEPACWYLTESRTCDEGVGLRIVRGEDPPPDTFADGRCTVIPSEEVLCSDGKDNDEDCLTDRDDPDCQQ